MLAAKILNSIHDAASYLEFICRVRIRVRFFRSCPVYPLARCREMRVKDTHTHTRTHARTHTRRLPYASGLRPPRHNEGRARGRSFGPRDYMYIAVFAQTPCPRRGTNLHFCLYLASHVFSQFAQVYELRRILSIGHYCVVEWNDDPFG